MSDDWIAAGAIVMERYRLESMLGEGATSSVWRALRLDDREHVAIKILGETAAESEIASERLFREARAIAKLDHPGVVKLYDWGIDRGRPYVALELIDGESLREMIDRVGWASQSRAVAFIQQICNVLTLAHDHGIIHRDLKPENIMLEGGTIRVLDFGIARMAGTSRVDETAPRELTRPGTTLGTPTHMSPEQARGKNRRRAIGSLFVRRDPLRAGERSSADRRW